MKTIIAALQANPGVSGYRINENRKESYELFFVKGNLETVRSTDTCDKQITVYVDHEQYKGDAQFMVYPSTTQEELEAFIETAVEKAKIIHNKTYQLPQQQTGTYTVQSNFSEKSLQELASVIKDCVFRANTLENASLNSVEVFVNKYTETVCNSCGVLKTQTRYDAMVEAIPTYNGEDQSVELYQQYNFNNLDEAQIEAEIAEKLQEVKARYEAVKPDAPLKGAVILNKLELSELFGSIVQNLNYASVYAKASVFHKGDQIQKNPVGDKISVTMAGELPGNIRSAKFDTDGMALQSIRLIEDGVAMNYYGGNRFGQYLDEEPTGLLRCMQVEPGTACEKCLMQAPYLEIISMSGLQVDFYNDYIGGEVRLAYYHDGSKCIPVTGVSVTGKLTQVLSSIRLSKEIATHNGYMGPAKAILQDMQIF